MCILCLKPQKEFSIEHMQMAMKKLNEEEKRNKAKFLKDYLANHPKWRGQIPDELYDSLEAHAREAQYLLARDM